MTPCLRRPRKSLLIDSSPLADILAVFFSSGKDFMLEAIDILKGVSFISHFCTSAI
jgi:hypothetical protein